MSCEGSAGPMCVLVNLGELLEDVGGSGVKRSIPRLAASLAGHYEEPRVVGIA